MTCLEVATAAGLQPGKRSGQELLFTCPRHDDQKPSLSVNDRKNVWMCGPCNQHGTAWQLMAFLAGVAPSNKEGVKRYWFTQHAISLDSGNGTHSPSRIVATYQYV